MSRTTHLGTCMCTYCLQVCHTCNHQGIHDIMHHSLVH
uniref:Uncharacterized protein n=1 Tax=Arundo donax TaxID=35708 RepID=A0A0A9AXI3_ARUDO